MSDQYSHLIHIENVDELRLYDLIPDAVWVFDLDKHGWFWGNQAAVDFWGLASVDELINKDLSGDTQGARDRTRQTFDLAAAQGLTIDPWTTYPGGVPKTLFMRHRAVTLGPERHRGIIAFINEEVNLGERPENLLLVEAARYTNVLVTSYTLEGEPVVENPAATEAYKYLQHETLESNLPVFAARFADHTQGLACFKQAMQEQGGRYDCQMRTAEGVRSHTLDIRKTRHPLTGDFLLLVVEYDVTPLHEALAEAEKAKEKLRLMAHYDALTGLPSQHLFQEQVLTLINQAIRHQVKLAVMFIDLDDFKPINDTWGHDAGDQVLKEVAQRLQSALRGSDMVARIGGDEFVLLQTDVCVISDVQGVAEKILTSLADPVLLENGSSVVVGASIGVSFFPDHGRDSEALIKAADNSMYKVKKTGKNNIYIAEF